MERAPSVAGHGVPPTDRRRFNAEEVVAGHVKVRGLLRDGGLVSGSLPKRQACTSRETFGPCLLESDRRPLRRDGLVGRRGTPCDTFAPPALDDTRRHT